MFTPRPKQKEVLRYRGGKMGVSAVPGSGKTQTLSYLAAEIIGRGELNDDQEVLIVTLVNSAVDNFAQRVGSLIQERGLLPNIGYRVRTLHGLAHDIVRERPSLVGLADDFQIVDERVADDILTDAAQAWIRGHPYAPEEYFNPDLDESRLDWLRRGQLPELVNDIALSFIRYAKDTQITPERLQEKLHSLSVPLPLAEMGCEIYADYQRALSYRGAVDFDDLIRLALQALQSDPQFLLRLQEQWPFILEDEAQDSSRLQEEILKLLTGNTGNWVRVGDPNQAIYETFTTASPKYLRDFLERPEVFARELPNSGRSTRSIIKLANHLIRWTQKDHPLTEVRNALTPPLIKPTPRGDPQPNPPDDPSKVFLIAQKYAPQEEIRAVVDSVGRWLPDHPEETVAILVPRNQRGFEVVNELKGKPIEYEEILRSSSATRVTAGMLGNIVKYLSDPGSASKLTSAYKAWRGAGRDVENSKAKVERIAELLRKCQHVEDYIWPRLDRDWMGTLNLPQDPPDSVDLIEELTQFRDMVRRWQGTTQLPIDQIILTLAQDLFTEPADLAVAHKLAVLLRRAGETHLDWRLPEMTEELAVVARNERRFLGFSEDDRGFDPERYKGKAVVATIHKAKGLEWDRVYLMSVNNYDFPSGQPQDRYISEKWFIRDNLNLEAETIEQLKMAFSTDPYAWYEEGSASQQARQDYIAERLRLLFVGITRAKKELIITWNSGRDGSQQPAIPLITLQTFWEQLKTKPKTSRLRRRSIPKDPLI